MTQILKTTLLMGGLTGLFMFVGYLFGGQSGMLMALGFASLTNIGMYWFSDSLVLKMQGAQPLNEQYPEVRRIVTDLAQRENMPMPALYYVDTPIPNAFATGRSPRHAAVAVTSGIMEILDERELRAVLAHELGHVKNRDMLVSTIAACLAGAISYIAQFAFMFGGGDRENGGNPIAAIAAALLAPFAAMIIQMAISRSREFLADQHSAELLHDGDALASALMKLDSWKQQVPPIQPTPNEQALSPLMFANMFSAQGLASLFSTHPSTAARVARLKKLR
ncbi:MAG: zinc metalloprotease HtpX [Candidatus Saccharibacteria bacterium]|nr:zinc metalloprotease HtpX [Candidatus Saccharibacteria bacterium]